MAKVGIKGRLLLVALAPTLVASIGAGRIADAKLQDRRAAARMRVAAIELGQVDQLRAAVYGEDALVQLVTRLPGLGVSLETASALLGRDVQRDLDGQQARVDELLAAHTEFTDAVAPLITLGRAQAADGTTTPDAIRQTYDKAETAVHERYTGELDAATTEARSLSATSEVQDAMEAVRQASVVSEFGTAQVSGLADGIFAKGDERTRILLVLAATHSRYKQAVMRLDQLDASVVSDAVTALTSQRDIAYFLDEIAAITEKGELARMPDVSSLITLVQVFRGALAFEDGLSPVVRASTDELAHDVEVREQQAREEFRTALLLLSAVILGSVLIAGGTAVSLARPLRRLADDVRRVRSGALDHSVSLGSRTPEIHVLQEAVSDLVTTLRAVDQQAEALADGRLDAPVLAERVPGNLGRSLQESVVRLSTSMAHERDLRARLEHEASHDGLTGLVNRSGVLEHTARTLSSGVRSGRSTALLFIDLDDFKRVNDNHGHAAGDEVLRVVAARLADLARGGDVVARLGGDEFVAVVSDVSGAEPAVALAHRVLAAMSEPIEVDGDVFVVGASVGVALASDGQVDALELLEQADVAVFRAKTRGKSRVEVFDADLQRQLEEHAEIERALAEGMARDELVVHYQPIVAAGTLEAVAVEALVRWERPGHGLVSPAVFVPVAEDSDLIIELGRCVLRRATAELAACCNEGGAPLALAVNVSARHVASGSLLADVRDALAMSGLPADRLTVEITETVLVTDLPFLAEQLQQLRALGVRVAIDDFGTGFTSLAHLRQLPADVIKIDRSFVAELGNDSNGSLVRVVIDLGHQLGLEVVAEGVESAEQLALLQELGCDRIQGFLLARPMPAPQCQRWLDDRAGIRVASGAPEME